MVPHSNRWSMPSAAPPTIALGPRAASRPREPWPPSLTGAGESQARRRRYSDVCDRQIIVSTVDVSQIADCRKTFTGRT